MMVTTAKILKYRDNHLYLLTDTSIEREIVYKGIETVEVRFNDGRTIANEQRKKIYATFRDISLYTGYDPDYTKLLFKHWFVAYTGREMFSLSDVDMSTANKFLEFLVEFCIEEDIPTLDSNANRHPDVYRYVYKCLCEKVCCVCGNRITRITNLHHVDCVGSRGNRKEINHIGLRAEPLCGIHHKQVHDMGQATFDELYLVQGVKIDRTIAEIYNLNYF